VETGNRPLGPFYATLVLCWSESLVFRLVTFLWSNLKLLSF